MKNMSRLLAAGALLAATLVSGQALAQDRDIPAALRPYMSAEEYRAAGLHKLNPAELAQFQAWFVRTMRSGGEDPLARVPEARPATSASGPRDPRLDEIALERRRLAEERAQLEVERRALTEQRAEQAAVPSGRASADAATETQMDGFGARVSSGGDSRMDARIAGTFNGWNGPTRFELDNGQVWESIGASNWQPPRPMMNPAVIIRRGTFSSFSLQVEGFNRRVQVQRIQ